jgi:uncharacterized protein YcaQ
LTRALDVDAPSKPFASAIPTAWYPHWKPRLIRDEEAIRARAWWRERIGPRGKKTMAEVVARIGAEGPLSTSDFGRGEETNHPGE